MAVVIADLDRRRTLDRTASTRLRAGVIGLGHQATSDHLPGLDGSARATLVAVCDANREVMQDVSARFKVPGYCDLNEMLDAEDLDLVIATVPHDVGRAVIAAAAAHGIHVLKEKPFATTFAEARELANTCKDAGIRLMVTLQRRFNPIYASFLQLADQIGEPFVIDSRYTLHVEDPSAGWRGQTSAAGGGCIIDMGYHIIDLLLWYFGLPDRVFAEMSVKARPDRTYDAEDTALIHFGYGSGLYGSLLLSRYVGPKQEQIRLIGSRGIVNLERGRNQRLTNGGDVIESLTRDEGWPSAATAQIDHFVRVIEGSRPNVSGPVENLAHMAFITACYESAYTRAEVDPKELLR